MAGKLTAARSITVPMCPIPIKRIPTASSSAISAVACWAAMSTMTVLDRSLSRIWFIWSTTCSTAVPPRLTSLHKVIRVSFGRERALPA